MPFRRNTIQIHQGHHDIAHDPDWVGTVEAYWANNPDLTFGDISDMRRDLADFGSHRIGGGAQGCFTILTPAEAKVRRALCR